MPPSRAGRSCGSITRTKVRPRPEPERVRRLLQARVEPAQRGRDRQEDQREVGQRGDRHRAGVAVQPGRDRDPAERVDERGHRERRHQQHRPHPTAGQVGPLDQPGRPMPISSAERDAADGQPDGVPEQVGGALPEDQPGRLGPAGLQRLVRDEAERQQRRAPRPRSPPAPAAPAAGGLRRRGGRCGASAGRGGDGGHGLEQPGLLHHRDHLRAVERGRCRPSGGSSSDSGLSFGLAATPVPTGYSSALLSTSACWPCLPVR